MSEPVSKIAIVSGYFNPLHVGHLTLMESAREFGEQLVVVVNNDTQQIAKKGKVYTPGEHRLRMVRALRLVDEAFLAIDEDDSVSLSLQAVRHSHPNAELHFCNGGDRRDSSNVPSNEALACRDAGIIMHFGVGGVDKLDSSSRIIQGTPWGE